MAVCRRKGGVGVGGAMQMLPSAVLTGEVPFGPRGPSETAVRNTGPDRRARLGHMVPKKGLEITLSISIRSKEEVKTGEKLRLFSF